MANDKYTKKNAERMIDALKKCLGIKTQAAKMCGHERHIIDRWAKAHPEFADAMREVEEMQKDYVESQFLGLIKDGDAKCIIHYMRTKCKDRGYGDNMDLTSKNEKLDLRFEIVTSEGERDT